MSHLQPAATTWFLSAPWAASRPGEVPRVGARPSEEGVRRQLTRLVRLECIDRFVNTLTGDRRSRGAYARKPTPHPFFAMPRVASPAARLRSGRLDRFHGIRG